MATITVSVSEFRQLFPVFSNTTKYPDTLVQITLDTAIVYIPNQTNEFVKETVIKQMIYLLTAHMLVQNTAASAGNALGGGVVQSAHIDGVSVTKMTPPARTAFAYWLSSSAFGLQLLALLKMQATVGIYFGGTKENVFR